MSKPKALGLVDFMKQKKRDECPVCQLPAEIRAQLAEASAKGITRKYQTEWLTQEVKAEVTYRDLEAHTNGRHEA